MQKVIVCRGIPASGKSTWAHWHLQTYQNFVRINKDSLREMMYGDSWTVKQERFIIRARDALLEQFLLLGKSVIIDDTNFRSFHIERIKQLAEHCEKQLNFQSAEVHKILVEIKDFEIDLETAIERDLKRARSVGERVIRKMYNEYVKEKVEPPVYNPDLPNAIICDLDGTLSLLNGRSPYDASTCEQDLLNQSVYSVLNSLSYKEDLRIIYVSGREDKYREQTERFLKSHGLHLIGYEALYMRKTGDSRKDSIVKEEIYRNHIKDKFNVKLVLDDRNQVVEMWRNLGLTVFQVADGDF